jgi:hypothetical protein
MIYVQLQRWSHRYECQHGLRIAHCTYQCCISVQSSGAACTHTNCKWLNTPYPAKHVAVMTVYTTASTIVVIPSVVSAIAIASISSVISIVCWCCCYTAFQRTRPVLCIVCQYIRAMSFDNVHTMTARSGRST